MDRFRNAFGSATPTNNNAYTPVDPRAGLFDSRRGAPPPQQAPRGVPPPPQQYRDVQPAGYTRNVPPPPPQRSQQGSGFSSRVLRVNKIPSDEMAIMNFIAVSPSDFPPDVGYIIIDDQYVLTAQAVPTVAPGTLGASFLQREWAAWSLNQEVTVASYDPFARGDAVYLGTLDVELSFMRPNKGTDQMLDPEDMAQLFTRNYQQQIFAPGQRLVIDYKAIQFRCHVKSVQLVNLAMNEKATTDAAVHSDPRARGVLTPQTVINFYKAPDSSIRLKPSSKRPAANAIIAPDFKFEDMGIGGLDMEFGAIFRRAFASRIFPPGLVEKLGIQHVKGLLLYGPPGTGKTLMARQIGKMLNAREPKIVNGPEILNKFVGQSEENIRKLFADAEKEQKEKGDESGLHIIIFDELDAICKQRGSKNDGTGVGDSVVNQLLAKMDGVDQLNNILIIGMTNRMDMIDEALLRAGRLEVHMEISLPDESGRVQILKIHTAKMRDNHIMAPDVDIEELASLTKNFTGADISGLVKSASSFAFNRHVKVGTMAGVSEDIENMKVTRDDFMHALEEVKPAFGVSEEELATCIQNGIISFSSGIENILQEGRLFIQQVRQSERTPLVSVLMHGPSGSGKTALAASIAMASEFPFVKLISPESMIGYTEASKVAAINKVFNDSYKSPLSVVVVDNIERLLDWVPIGPRFSNAVLQALMVLLRKQPPKGRRLLILATTTERSVLQQMDLLSCFDSDLPVPTVNTEEELAHVLKTTDAFSEAEVRSITQDLEGLTGSNHVGVGIKRVLTMIETARQDEDAPGRFVELTSKAIAQAGRM